jgi:hypothetical protein
MPSLPAIEVKAAHSDGYSSRCSAIIRTARSRTSGEYRLCLGISPSSQGKESAQFPGRFKDPTGLFNSSLEGRVRRAIDIKEGEKINEKALKNLVREAVALNLEK